MLKYYQDRLDDQDRLDALQEIEDNLPAKVELDINEIS